MQDMPEKKRRKLRFERASVHASVAIVAERLFILYGCNKQQIRRACNTRKPSVPAPAAQTPATPRFPIREKKIRRR